MNNKQTRMIRWLFSARRYAVFFLLISFVVTCCMLLFLETLQKSMGLTLTEEGISQAAKLTFVNVVIISMVCTIIDGVRRWYMVERPVRRIAQAADKVMQGDFTVRIQPVHSLDSQDGFNIIIDYFNRMTKELSGIETLRTDFIANVSHELKTPLAVMQNYGILL